MKDRKLVSMLEALSASERNKFETYLSAPYCNKKGQLPAFYQLLQQKVIGRQKQKEVTILLAQSGNPDFTNLSIAQIKKLKNSLQTALIDFLAIEKFKANPQLKNRFLLEKLNELQLGKYFPAYYTAAKTRLSTSQLPEAEYHHEQLLLEEEFNLYLQYQPQRHSQDHLAEAIRHLETSFLIRMLKFNLLGHARKTVTGRAPQSGWTAIVLERVQADLSAQPHIVQFYYYLYQLETQPDQPENFAKLKQGLKEHTDKISKEESFNLYTGLLNYAIKKVNAGDRKMQQEMHQLYKEMLASGVLLQENKLSPWHLKNIVVTGCRVGEFEWVKNLLTTWQDRILEDYRNNAIDYNLGVLYFFMKQYDQAEAAFNRVLDGYKDVFYGLDARGFLLPIYYETANTTGMESLIHSFRMYLDRNKEISQGRKKNYRQFIRFYRRLANSTPNSLRQLLKLRKDILEQGMTGAGRRWLLQKVDEMLKKNSPVSVAETGTGLNRENKPLF